MRLVLGTLVAVLAVLASPTASVASATPGDVRVLTETFVDTTRATPASGSLPEAASRSLETTIYVPPGRGRRPLIVFAHGMSGHPDKFTRLLGTWAAAGYVVAAPAFPLTNDTVPDESRATGDVVHQPEDLSFVLTSVLTEYDAIGEQITTDFWDATLKGKQAAFRRLERDATVERLSSIEVKP